MKKYVITIFWFCIIFLIFYSLKVEALLPLTGKTIIIDPGHGGSDPGTSYNNVLEKNINLKISNYLYEELSELGANVILTRDGDYDLSSPRAIHRKKSDFDNRIKLINESNANLYLSIHLNYLSNSSYYGPQVFYNSNNEELARTIQNAMNNSLNNKREIKKIPDDTYMYKRLKVPGVLIECGFISNAKEREILQKDNYQKKIADAITIGVLEYF
jgi:N-acetylmuramoyl-L-alanine amidase